MADVLEKLDGALIQHGPANDRVYLMKLPDRGAVGVLPRIDELADDAGYSKIFAKAPEPCRDHFRDHGYIEEARVPGYYRLTEDCCYMSRFLAPERSRPEPSTAELDAIIDLARRKAADGAPAAGLPASCSFRICGHGDIPDFVDIYRQVFASYPFPIHDPEYVAGVMGEDCMYFGIWQDDRLIAVAAAERDRGTGSVEMTDFATRPSARGQGFGGFLLARLEDEMRRRGVLTAHTIARAVSPGMNIVFARHGYRYGGRLINNTDICGRLESMNVWWKTLDAG